MKVSYTPHFKRSFKFLTEEVKKKFEKQVKFLLKDIRHPSLRAKKYDGRRDIWQARVNGGYRFYFLIKGDTYILIEIKPHPK
jgi:mRNA-degrading endonuclease RelE of RelBE toxin-antitoxin system